MVEETVMEMRFSAQEEAFRRKVRDFRPADRVRRRGPVDYLAILAALNDADLGAEPTILGTTDCPFFEGPRGEHFTVATSLVGSLTFPSYLRGMWRADLADDPRFATAAARRAHFTELRCFLQTWILTFHDIGALDAQLDEAKIALGEARSLKKLSEMNGRNIGARSKKSRTATVEPTACPAVSCISPAKSSSPP
jgi:crotonobetainyl-CoA:carnitine CoA-transferase CaiB-like acyl-CoA transferase